MARVRTPRRLVALERASVTLGGAAVLRDVTLSLRAGDRVAVVGANGSGKSTLLRLLRGDQWLDPRLPGGRRFWTPGGGASSSPIGARERMALVGPEGQDEYARLELDLPVEAVIRSGFDGERYPTRPATPRRTALIERAAAGLGVGALLHRRFLSLSRGEARRVLVARALAPEPAVLLLDEVCDGLDAAAREALLKRLASLGPGLAVVTATHREEEIFAGVERVIRLERGRVVADRLRDDGPEAGGRAATGRGAGGRASAGRAAGGDARDGGLADGRAPAGRATPRRVAVRGAPAGPLQFVLRDATVLVDGRRVLDRVGWTIRAGEAWGITGPNGAGKSTLLRLLAGEEQPASGVVQRLDLGSRADADQVRRRVGLVSPELQARHRLEASGEAVVLSGFLGTVGLAERPTRSQRRAAAGTLARLGLARLRRRAFLTCSYGEQRLLLLARALVARPEALLLDEPFAGLSPELRRALAGTLSALHRQGTTLVLVSHHEDELHGLAARRARLDAGRLDLLP